MTRPFDNNYNNNYNNNNNNDNNNKNNGHLSVIQTIYITLANKLLNVALTNTTLQLYGTVPTLPGLIPLVL